MTGSEAQLTKCMSRSMNNINVCVVVRKEKTCLSSPVLLCLCKPQRWTDNIMFACRDHAKNIRKINRMQGGCASVTFEIVTFLFVVSSISDSVSPRHLYRRERKNIPSAPQQNKLPESQSVEYMPDAKDLTDHIYSLVEAQLNEENPYECISEPPLQPPSDKAEGVNESPSPTMTKPDDNHFVSALNKPVNKQAVEQPHALPQHLTDSEQTAVYAAVNWKTKSQKNVAPLFQMDTVVDMSDIAKEAVPPIPDKHF
ncbi:uncharacterized protein LOC131526659 isoform X1 [Onychostoma macrolepis]|uniref:uncharacterized protein LOC131526659 isoform X1 n=1 Tax=Onychostoma macrolepis TaxID=369639 RepID=UPI002729AA33|nr:uncharacterized protein LOC131526659 isoform X1 [Onychostoma macrolepis]